MTWIEAALARHLGLRGARADVRSLPCPDEHFDLIVSTSTLDRFDDFADLVAGLRERQRVLRPGGALILTLDNLANPAVRLPNAVPFPFLNGSAS